MDYIFNISCLIAVFISFLATIRLWKNYKKTNFWQFKNYSFAFWFIFLAFLFLSLPKLILFKPFWIQIDFILVDLSFLGVGLFFIPALLSFSEKFSKFQKKIFPFLILLILIYIFLNILFFSPAVPLFLDGILFYWKNGNFLLHSMLWIPLTLPAAINGILFLSRIKKIKEKQLFWKSLFIGLGSISIFIAGILFWYFKFFNPLPVILNVSGIIGDFGFISGVVGATFFQPPREILVKKIT